MDRNKELKVHRSRLPGRSLCSIRSNRKWCKRRGSFLQCQSCFFVYPIIDCNLKNLYLSVVTAVSVPHVAINIPWNVLPICLSNSLMSDIDTAFLPLMKTCVTFSYKTVPYLTVFFMLFPVSFYVCFTNKINQEILLPVLLWFSILLAGI